MFVRALMTSYSLLTSACDYFYFGVYDFGVCFYDGGLRL
jgi:hypothetical protein